MLPFVGGELAVTVTVDVEAIQRLWAGEGNREHVCLLLAGAGDLDSRERLAAAIQQTNDALSDWLDDDLERTVGRPPSRIEAGAIWEVECFHRDGPRRWLDELSGRLQSAGLSGEVRARPYPNVGRFDTLEDGQTGRSAGIIMAPSGWSTVNRKAIIPSWKVEHGQVPDLIELVMTFLVDEPSRLVLNVGVHSNVSRRSLGPLLSEALASPRGDEPLVDVRQFGGAVNRSVSFDGEGRVLLTTVATEETLFGHIRRGCDLVLPWGPRCDWVVLMENSLSPTYDDAYRNARGVKLPREVARGRSRDTEPLPDAYPWAIVSTAQLPPSLNPNRWDVKPLDSGKFVVEAKDLPAWFAGPEPLLQARREWSLGSEQP